MLYWRHGSSVDNKFFMENDCRVNNAFILDERQPCIIIIIIIIIMTLFIEEAQLEYSNLP